ncbi:MAG: hypothetical protein FWH49_05025 [Clostridiales bacterium]|nr:hypothetical protein [Clostridiales bacterium]
MFSDTHGNKDPDTHSRTLRDYHLLLWDKLLPNGKRFSLTSTQKAPYYLTYRSVVEEFVLSSDSIVHTYSRRRKDASISNIVKQVDPMRIMDFYALASTIGGYIIFPANQIDRKPTINCIRAMHPKIGDRFDFALECIRRWYIGIESPLSAHLDRYGSFFRLFLDFQGYYRFFLLDDLVDTDTECIRFWLPFSDFGKIRPIPDCLDEYLEYMKNITEFTKARNARITTFTEQINRILTSDEFSTAAAIFEWTFAKTMPQCPHEYIVRGKTADDNTYIAMFRTIEAHGVWGIWKNTRHQYLHPGDGHYYWKMTDDISESIIINRATEANQQYLPMPDDMR